MYTKLSKRHVSKSFRARNLLVNKSSVSTTINNVGFFSTLAGITTDMVFGSIANAEEITSVAQKIDWLLEQDFDDNALYILISNAAFKGNKDDIIALCEVAKQSKLDLTHYSVGESVLEAISKGNLDIAIYLLEQGAPRRGFLENAFNYAILTGDIVQIRKLLQEDLSSRQHGAITSLPWASYITPLKLACNLGYIDVVDLFLVHLESKAKYPIHWYFNDVTRALFTIDRQVLRMQTQRNFHVDHLACIKRLIDCGLDIHKQFGCKNTALTYAAEINDVDAAALLIKHGAKDTARKEGPYLFSPPSISMLMAHKNLHEIARLLINEGAIEAIDEIFKPHDDRAHTALSCAAYYGSHEVTHLLLKAGADKTLACKLLKWSPLVWVASVENTESLVRYIAEINVLDEQHNVQLAAKMAVKLNRPEVLKLLIDAQVDVNHIYECNRTLVHYAADKGHTACLQLLIEANADINIIEDKMQGGRDAVWNAMRNGHYDCLELLLNEPTLTMDAVKKDPFFLRLHKPTVRYNTIDGYKKDKEYHSKINEKLLSLQAEENHSSCSIRC